MKLIPRLTLTGESAAISTFRLGALLPEVGGAPAACAAGDYVLTPVVSFEDDDVQTAWRRLLIGTSSPEPMYQTPEFFRHILRVCPQESSDHALFAVRRRADLKIVGIVPVRRQSRDIAFRIGRKAIFKRSISICLILGSVPLLDPEEPGLDTFVLKKLLAQLPDCQSVVMPALPAEQFHRFAACDGLSSYVLDGWRNCHVSPLPADVDTYLQKFSAKKRYNLSRQVRLLAKEAGDIQVLRVEQPIQIDTLMTALRKVAPPCYVDAPARSDCLASLARQGLLLCYVIRCAGDDLAVVLGMRSNDAWCIHNIWCDPRYARLSLGTSAIHLALLDVIRVRKLARADFGYGTPKHDYRSTHVLVPRGHVMLYRSRSALAWVLRAHGICDRANMALVRLAKRCRAAYVAKYHQGQRRHRAAPTHQAAPNQHSAPGKSAGAPTACPMDAH